MSAHTGGPWVKHPRFQDYIVPAEDIDKGIGMDFTSPELCRLKYARVIVHMTYNNFDGMSIEERIANKSLVEAAPDLLEAAKLRIHNRVTGPSPIAVHPSGMFCTWCGHNSAEELHNPYCVVMMAEKAIAVAEGRS